MRVLTKTGSKKDEGLWVWDSYNMVSLNFTLEVGLAFTERGMGPAISCAHHLAGWNQPAKLKLLHSAVL